MKPRRLFGGRKMAKETKAILRDIVEVLTALTVFGILLWLFLTLASVVFGAARAEEGVGRATTCLRAAEREEEYESAEKETEALRRYVEGEGEAPAWYKPDEEIAVEWVDNVSTTSTQRKDAGCPDYNVESVLYGWGGRVAEQWELQVLARVFYLEFNTTSEFCWTAGADAILNLWGSGLYGETLGAALSAVNDFGKYVYSVYPDIWTEDFDADALQRCYDFCLERFMNEPEFEVMYFQLYGYHDPSWTIPCFECDGVYFSIGK